MGEYFDDDCFCSMQMHSLITNGTDLGCELMQHEWNLNYCYLIDVTRGSVCHLNASRRQQHDADPPKKLFALKSLKSNQTQTISIYVSVLLLEPRKKI